MCDGLAGWTVCLPSGLLVFTAVRGGVLLEVLQPLFSGRVAEEGRKWRKYLAEVYFWAAGQTWEEIFFPSTASFAEDT